MDLQKGFASGLEFVGISRVRSLQHLLAYDVSWNKFKKICNRVSLHALRRYDGSSRVQSDNVAAAYWKRAQNKERDREK